MELLSVLILILDFLFFFLILSGRDLGEKSDHLDWREIFLSSSVWLALIMTGGFIGLSILSRINRIRVISLWALVLMALLVWGYLSKRFTRGWSNLTNKILRHSLPKPERAILVFALIILVVLFLIVVVSPPNTNDSLRYHMARVMHWQQNQSLAHYNTPIDAQLWMPPWSEMAILNLVILCGGDHLANLVQWMAMLSSLIGVSWIAKLLGAGNKGQVFSLIFSLTLPMGILQSTSTQNDYTTAFWAVCLAAFLIKNLRDNSSLWLIGLSAALGILTKGSFYPYAIAFIAGWGIIMLANKGWRRVTHLAAILIICVVTINGYSWWLNSRTFGFFLGPSEVVREHTNESYTPGAMISNLIRNSTIHLGTPYGIINGNLQRVVEKIHGLIGEDTTNSETTYDDYRVKRYLTEDRAGNPWHFLTPPIFAFFWLLGRKRKQSFQKSAIEQPEIQESRTISWYAGALLGAFLLFSILYKWQSTGSRLQLPWFVLLAPWVGVLWERMFKSNRRYFITALFLLLSLPHVFNNPARPFFPFKGDPQTIWNTDREVLLFRNNPDVMPGYVSLISRLKESGCDQVGMYIDSSDPEYVVWALSESQNWGVRFEHLFPDPPMVKSSVENFSPCAVVCTTCNANIMYGLPLDSTHYGGFSLYLEVQNQP